MRDALSRDLEAARYAADRTFRQFDAADPANRGQRNAPLPANKTIVKSPLD